MENIDDDYLTNLSWLKLRTNVECTNKHIDDDLHCLCWLHKIRPLKERKSKRSENVVGPSSSSRRILMVQTLNDHLFPNKTSQQSFIVIRSSNGKLSCLSIHHNTFNEEKNKQNKFY